MKSKSNKTVSEKQLSANRRNAQRSTGPRTAQGRAASKMNALKHGILSQQLMVQSVNYTEDPDQFAALHQEFIDTLQPVGALEEMLVEQIVSTHWRLRRVLRAESGEIALKSLFKNYDVSCSPAKGPMARREERAYPQWSVSDEQRRQRAFCWGTRRANGSFGGGHRWLLPCSPTRDARASPPRPPPKYPLAGHIVVLKQALCHDAKYHDPKTDYDYFNDWNLSIDPIPRMEKTEKGNIRLDHLLCDVYDKIEADGDLTEAAVNIFTDYWKRETCLSKYLQVLMANSEKEDLDLPEGQRRARRKEKVQAELDKLIDGCVDRVKKCRIKEASIRQARLNAAALPVNSVLTKIMRYESQLQRQLTRTLRDLTQAQQARLAHTAEPPEEALYQTNSFESAPEPVEPVDVPSVPEVPDSPEPSPSIPSPDSISPNEPISAQNASPITKSLTHSIAKSFPDH